MDKKKTGVQNPKSKTQNRKVSAARLAAFEILLKIEREKAFSSVLLPLYEEKLETKDRALCHRITLGVLRNQILLDRIVGNFIRTKIEKLDAEVLIALRIGLYQLAFLDKIPPFSAINESVNLIKQAKKSSAGSLVNAVLRRATEKFQLKDNIITSASDNVSEVLIRNNNKLTENKLTDLGIFSEVQGETKDDLEILSVLTSHPRWLLENWARQFGFEETKNLARANNETPFLTFRLTGKGNENTIGILKKLGLEIEESNIVPDAWRASKTSDFLRGFADEGKIYFQEESSQLVGQAVSLRAGESFLDVCAAPGSKATFVAIQNAKRRMQNEKIDLFVAGDLHSHRLRVLRETCEKVGAKNVEIIAYDAETALPFADESFDCVLIDAPCSGTGTIRHNPEIRYFVAASDFSELAEKQLRILENASKLLRRGGRIIYSTCSLEIAENETVIEKFLASNPAFRKAQPKLPQQFLTDEGFARTFPHRDETDGFFIAQLERR